MIKSKQVFQELSAFTEVEEEILKFGCFGGEGFWPSQPVRSYL